MILEEDIRFTYTFSVDNSVDNAVKRFEITLDPADLSYQSPVRKELPEWTKLNYHQCPNCPLSAEKHTTCPVAENIVDATEAFRDWFSFENVHITIETPERTYSKLCPIQEGLSSLLGIIMSTSGCPVLDKLRPMARTHLPFASTRESLYRALSMYITAQHFRERRGLKADYSFKGLTHIYDEVTIVNRSFCKRLAQETDKDANVNAIVILNCLAEFATLSIRQDLLDELESLFWAYLTPDQK